MNSLRDILLRVVTTRAAWPILISVALLCAMSLAALEVVSPERFKKQEVWLMIGAGVILVALLPHYNVLGAVAYALYGVTIVLLVAVMLAPKVANTHRWFVFPGGTQFQPSEVAKIAFVLALAWYLRYRQDLRTVNGLMVPFAMAFVPFVLILIEPDLGTALLFPLVLYAMLLAAGASLRHLVIIAVLALVAMPGAYPFLKPYQQERLKSQLLFLMDKGETPYQQMQSMVAIGSGGTSGQGKEAAGPIRQGLLPAAYTDFIFAVVGTLWGFAGCTLVLLFYLGFFAASVEVASTARDMFGRLLVIGLACMILFQAVINLNMTIGPPMPVVGVSLPFMSYGGSSLLASMLAVGLLLNVSVRRFAKRA